MDDSNPFGVFVVIFAIAIIVWVILSGRKRRKDLKAMAYSMGLSFRKSDKLDIGDTRFHRVVDGHRIYNVMSGHLDGTNIWLFSIFESAGPAGQNEYTVALFLSESIYLPDFDLQPKRESIGGKIRSAFFGHQGLDFESHPRFSSNYLLQGEPEYAICRIFTDEVLTFFSDNPGLSVVARGNKLIHIKKKVEPRDMPSFLDEAKTIFDLFRRSQDR